MFGKLRRPGGTIDTRAELEARLREHFANFSADQTALVTRAIGQATRVIMAKLANMERRMDVKIEELLDAVAGQQTKIDSLIELSGQLHARVLEAIGPDTLTPSQKMRIAQVFDAVKTNSDDIDAALKANTVDASAGAISDGPDMAAIKNQPPVTDPGAPNTFTDPLPGSTDAGKPAT